LASSERRRVAEILAISSTAARNADSFAFDGLLNPVIFLTNWIEADRISSAVTGGSKLKRGLMFLHMGGLGVQRSALTKVLLQYQRVISMAATTNATPECLELSVLDPGQTETDTKKSASRENFYQIIEITVVMVSIKPWFPPHI
jgi:hypothetical protein